MSKIPQPQVRKQLLLRESVLMLFAVLVLGQGSPAHSQSGAPVSAACVDSDHSNARIHSLEGMAMFTAGGRLKSGMHIDGNGNGSTVARLGYTAMRAMGVDIPSWGSNSNNTSKEVGEMLT